MFSQTHQSTVDVCKLIKELCPNVPIALGGVHITNSMMEPSTKERLFKDFNMVDLFFPYESELDFMNFIH